MKELHCLSAGRLNTARIMVSGLILVSMGVGCERRTEVRSSKNVFQADKDSLIEAGQRVGQLKLGDSRDHAFAVFPFKAGSDQEFETSDCGKEYLWTESEEPGKGNVFIRIESGKVFQIEVATTRFRTNEGLTTRSSPEEVRRKHKNLLSYALLGRFSEALGGVPLIYWIDRSKGLAFSFAAERRTQNRYLYSIIVFAPNGKFCPEGETTQSADWRELKPYSLTVENPLPQN